MNSRKKRRDIILDFTSLLDVIMIILFFFILFSHFEAAEAKNKMQAAQSEADRQTAAAEDREREAEKKLTQAAAAEKQANEAYERLKNEGNRSAENYDALHEFEQGRQLRLHLTSESGVWQLEFQRGDFQYAVPVDENLNTQVKELFEALFYTENSTILCEFSFDASARGSKAVYEKVNDVFLALREKYKYLYISELDESRRSIPDDDENYGG